MVVRRRWRSPTTTSSSSLSSSSSCVDHLLVVLQLAGLAIFVFGFFLTRFEVPHVSMCNDSHIVGGGRPYMYQGGGGAGSNVADNPNYLPAKGCWHPRRFGKAIVVVVDALRLDFAFSTPSDANNQVCKTVSGGGWCFVSLQRVHTSASSRLATTCCALVHSSRKQPPEVTSQCVCQRVCCHASAYLPTFRPTDGPRRALLACLLAFLLAFLLACSLIHQPLQFIHAVRQQRCTVDSFTPSALLSAAFISCRRFFSKKRAFAGWLVGWLID